jgi:hypothetical protein
MAPPWAIQARIARVGSVPRVPPNFSAERSMAPARTGSFWPEGGSMTMSLALPVTR